MCKLMYINYGVCVKLSAAFAAILMTACSTFQPEFDLAKTDQLIDYPIKTDQYVIVVTEEGGMSPSRARKMALQRAAELTLESGYRYYSIELEEKTEVVKSGDLGLDNIKAGESRNSSQKLVPNTGEMVIPALRVMIKCYKEKPDKNSYDAF